MLIRLLRRIKPLCKASRADKSYFHLPIISDMTTALRLVTVDQFGDVKYQPITSAYEQESGTVTLMPTGTLPAGTIIETDFYKDGYFKNTLTPEIMKILGLCFAYVWKLRFNNDWLSDVSKIEDNSFSEQNRANKERADSERQALLMEQLAGEVRAFAENVAYKKIVKKQNLPY